MSLSAFLLHVYPCHHVTVSIFLSTCVLVIMSLSAFFVHLCPCHHVPVSIFFTRVSLSSCPCQHFFTRVGFSFDYLPKEVAKSAFSDPFRLRRNTTFATFLQCFCDFVRTTNNNNITNNVDVSRQNKNNLE